MAHPIRYLPNYTYEDYKLWEGNWELIEGIPYAMSPSPNFDHQNIEGELLSMLRVGLKQCKTCSALAELDWMLSNNTIMKPDILVVCKPFDKGPYISKTPILITEILSASTAQKDRGYKLDLYESAGVKYYVIVNPMKHIVRVYQLKEGEYNIEMEGETGSFTFNFEGCIVDIDFAEIW